jgi:hypothetical protein
MIIDFHVHFFPDSLAQKAMDHLSTKSGVKPYGEGTFGSLADFMKESHIDLAVNQPVATSPEQVISINRKMIESNKNSFSTGIISFGAMHPDFARIGSIKDELSFIASNGIKGIKLHCEYQDFYPDEDKLLPVYESCSENGLTVLFHSGRDIGFTSLHATPERLFEVSRISGLRIVLAHMGGYRLWDDVEKYLVGYKNIYLDTAFTVEMSDNQMKEIINCHGAGNILFGSDFPWESPERVRGKIKALGLGPESENLIFHKNAEILLDL